MKFRKVVNTTTKLILGIIMLIYLNNTIGLNFWEEIGGTLAKIWNCYCEVFSNVF